ncbi:MAG: type IV pilus assembly protein PilW [Halioglobus sp.]|jgi:type IV pilus assembly protein PilW
MTGWRSGNNAVTCKVAPMTGLTLIELLISILLGAVLCLAISNVYLESIRHFMVENEMARLQENGRFSLNLLRTELSQAGFFAGVHVMQSPPSRSVSSDCVSSGNWALDTRTPLDFINNANEAPTAPLITTAGTALNCLNSSDLVKGTDVLAVKRTAGGYTLRNGVYPDDARARNGQWYLRVDNQSNSHTWVNQRSSGFPVADVTDNSGVDYWAYLARIFYVRNHSSTRSDGIPTLCIEALYGGAGLGTMRSQCVIEGVEDMQIEFGVDNNFDNSPDVFTDAPLESELANLVVARIYLLMRSTVEMPGVARERNYELGGKQVSTRDRYLRRIVSSTVPLPNIRLAMSQW